MIPGADLYKPSLALLTDLYQLTMAYGYWKRGLAEKEAVFHLFYRKNPFQSGYAIACGLHSAVEYMQRLRFDREDVAYLATLTGNDGLPLFESAFYDYLQDMKFSCDVDAIPEGTAVFPHQPLLRIRGPILQCQLLETPLLNLLNFQTLIATKAARICHAAKGDPVLEFGLRRAQGIDGALSASRSAHVGGCAATSNVLAGKLFGIPVKGTHAHSWVMSFDSEEQAFASYAEVMPNNCVFLVDTYDTLSGVRKAVQIGLELRRNGHELAGIRLDSGDLAHLSIEARKILDEAGFPKAAIVASNDLDEQTIASLKEQGAAINVWGVGTRLATAYDQPALGGVYKLGAIRDPGGEWKYKIKLSEQAIKVSTPGVLQVRRFSSGAEFIGDMIYNQKQPPAAGAPATIIDPADTTRHKTMPAGTAHEDLLAPVFRAGLCVYTPPPLPDIRQRAQNQLRMLHAGIKRFANPHQYPVGLERGLSELKTRLILEARGVPQS
jgi:nicotinate phosphoribosyltransferase